MAMRDEREGLREWQQTRRAHLQVLAPPCWHHDVLPTRAGCTARTSGALLDAAAASTPIVIITWHTNSSSAKTSEHPIRAGATADVVCVQMSDVPWTCSGRLPQQRPPTSGTARAPDLRGWSRGRPTSRQHGKSPYCPREAPSTCHGARCASRRQRRSNTCVIERGKRRIGR